jgi:hypothetical protein
MKVVHWAIAETWGNVHRACGTLGGLFSQEIKYVTCQNCLEVHKKYLKESK